MEAPFRFNTLRKTTIHFLNTFNGIKVDKYDSEGTITKTVDVPLKLASKQKFYQWLFDRKHEKRFPIMAGSVIGIKPAIGERARNQKLEFTTKDKQYQLQLPAPYTIEFELNIVTKYIDEANQILEQILPWFQPYRYVTVNLPEIDEKFDVKIILDSVSEDKDFEMGKDDYRTLSWTISFTAHTKIFKPIYDAKLIEKIYLDYRNMVTGNILQRSKTTEDAVVMYTYEELEEENYE